MTGDPYVRAARRWAYGAELVYRPLATELLASCQHPLAGRTVLDVGAGTGAVSAALTTAHAEPVAIDLSAAMLRWHAASRPPSAVADVRALPLTTAAVDDAVAAFVLNHLTDPATGLAELARVTGPGGAVLATVFSNDSSSSARDRIDAEARAAGWQPPPWYTNLKATAATLLGSPAAMAATARAARLADIHTEERPVDVGITRPHELVQYRLGHPTFAAWLDTIGPRRAQQFARRAEQAIRDIMQPYRPIVVFLSALAPS
jgi:SAM-dependent methyltransferase